MVQPYLERPTREPPIATVLGLDIGGTKTAVVLGRLDGQVYLRQEFDTPANRPFTEWFARLTETAAAVLAVGQARGLPAPVAVSAAVGGPLDIDGGVIYSPPHLPTWEAIPLKSRLATYFDLPTLVEHDGNAGALAEYYWGAGRGTRSLVFLTMGTGLGAGILLDGEVVRGATDTAGEVGHIRIAPDGPLLYGKSGAWEGYCSAAGLEQLAHLRAPDVFPGHTSAREILQAALTGQPEAARLIQEMGEWLGRGMAVLVDILNPQMIIVGTLGVVLGDLLLAPARAVLQAEALPVAARACQVVPARLGNDLGSVAALMAVSHAWRQGRLASSAVGTDLETRIVSALQAGMAVRQATLTKLSQTIVETAQVLIANLQRGGKVLACGNGGSASAASHLASELVGRFKADRRPLPALALTVDGSLLTCISNDYAYEDVFARQIDALAQPGDVVVGFTTSGRSPNVLRALATARRRGARALALTGRHGLAEPSVADYILAVPSDVTARIQEEHEAILHAWCEAIDSVFTQP